MICQGHEMFIFNVHGLPVQCINKNLQKKQPKLHNVLCITLITSIWINDFTGLIQGNLWSEVDPMLWGYSLLNYELVVLFAG